MMNRKASFFLGLTAAAMLAAFAQGGGYPTRPTFQSVGIGNPPPSGVGNVLASGDMCATTFCGSPLPSPSSPGGANGNVQFNNTGVFGGSADFTWDNTNSLLLLNSAGGGIVGALSNGLSFYGGNPLTDTTMGSGLFMRGGGSSGTGGDVLINGGTAVTSGIGGSINLNGGNADGTNQDGGAIDVSAGLPTGSGAGGTIRFLTNGIIRQTIALNGVSDFSQTPTVNSLAVATQDSGTFVATLTGYVTPPSPTLHWYRTGRYVTVELDTNSPNPWTGVSNSTAMAVSNLPSTIRPTNNTGQQVNFSTGFTNNSVGGLFGTCSVGGGSATMSFGLMSVTGTNITGSAFTAALNKGVDDNWTCTYNLY